MEIVGADEKIEKLFFAFYFLRVNISNKINKYFYTFT